MILKNLSYAFLITLTNFSILIFVNFGKYITRRFLNIYYFSFSDYISPKTTLILFFVFIIYFNIDVVFASINLIFI